MAFVALDDWCPISASDAEPKKIYRCLDCEKPVRLRRFRRKYSHFYHLNASPSCRLYSKSEDHLIAQLYIQKILPQGETKLEYPFPKLLRIADVLWENAKIAFEIQCSDITQLEIEQRTSDYAKLGYEVVWLLDDRLFNKRRLKKAETALRLRSSYFVKLRTSLQIPIFYDQFEVIFGNERIKKGRPLKIALEKPQHLQRPILEKNFPTQIEAKTSLTQLHFKGDLIYLACLANVYPQVAFSLKNLKALERLLLADAAKKRDWKRRWAWNFLEIFGSWVQSLLEWLWKKVN